jgi:hypothetical protein
VRKSATLSLVLSVGALLAGGAALAEEKKKGAPDEKAYIEAMMKAGTPGEQHKQLAALAGSWDVSVKMWLDPTKDPGESKASSETKIIMGGRYVEEKVTGDFGGMTFLGQGLFGYDNLRKKYTYTWIDNFGTGVSTAEGSFDTDKKTFTFKGEELDPLDSKKIKTKSVIHLIDKDSYEVDMYKVVEGKDVKAMHLDCKRKAAK